jgi:pyridoxine 4-dehydrogenase
MPFERRETPMNGIRRGNFWRRKRIQRGMSTPNATPNAKASGTFSIGGDLTVHRLGFGAMRITGDGVWGEPKEREEAKRVLKRLPDLGVNLIDTADAYGPEVSENLIAEALHPYPAGMIIATKGGFTRQGPNKWTVVGRPEYLRQCVEMSLRRLKLERIDLWQLHRIDPAVPVEDQIGELKKLQKEGKIRHIGLSEVSVKDIERAAKTAKIVSVQNKYNIADRTHEEVLQYCEKNSLGFIPWFPMEAGKLNRPGSSLEQAAKSHNASTAQLAVAWLLHHSPVVLPIPGTSSVKHLEENVAAAEVKLSDMEWQTLEKGIGKSASA